MNFNKNNKPQIEINKNNNMHEQKCKKKNEIIKINVQKYIWNKNCRCSIIQTLVAASLTSLVCLVAVSLFVPRVIEIFYYLLLF